MITLQRRGIVDVYNQYSFARASLAYGQSGKLYCLHNARFEPGKFAQAVMEEEGTTNVLPNPDIVDANADGLVDGWSINRAPGDQTLTYSIDQTGGFSGGAAQKVVLSGGTSGSAGRLYTTDRISVAAGATYTVSVYVRGESASSTALKIGGYLRAYDSSDADLGTVGGDFAQQQVSSSYQRFSWTRTLPSNAATVIVNLYCDPGKTLADKTFWIDKLQFEQKPYATSFIDSTRSPETLTIPTAGVLSAGEGTVEQYIKLLRAPGTNEQFLFDGAGSANQNLQVAVRTDGKVDVRYGTGSATVTITSTTVLTEDTWYAVAWRWSSAGVALLINGEVEASSTTPPSLSFGTNAYLACKADDTCQLDGLIDDLRISSRARTDAEIADAYASNAPLPVDADTTLKLDFDGPDAQRAAKVLVV